MPLSVPGPYNPMAMVLEKVARRILDLEYMEMAEIAAEDDLAQSQQVRLTLQSRIYQWLEHYSVMAAGAHYSVMVAILATRFPEKAPELLAYQSSIIRAERNYEGKQWVAYDRQYRREPWPGKT